ncbi:ATP-binding cassette domain-containing protein [Nitrosomonas sp.]|uniref:ATP-binding cassette domain-containing protein n=1 Tax=Nitrosomonas sp. TaxID=42353 RepID=UPI0025CE549B|nr:ATP-binding cassette domain-containing protein [Nitrosomonas sp.]MCC6916278.1 ATP-binding cassette domain-containing protein [Nitrosomonas sp.]
MSLLTLENACLAFGHHALLNHAALQLDPGERIGLIGRNGTGKSSLLRALAGEIRLDDGQLRVAPGVNVAYIPQEPVLDEKGSVFAEVACGLGALSQILLDYHEVSHALGEAGADIEVLLNRMQHLQGILEAQNGWSIHHKVQTAINRLELSEDAIIGSLSGGGRKRVALARALVTSPDVLLLDEPTNHLDFSSIEWLEETLQNFPGSVILITHDRRFLDNVATRIVELDRGELKSFSGNFSAYQKKKAEQLEIEAVHNRKFDKILDQEEVWIRKGIEARRTRNEGRVRRLEALRLERAARRNRIGDVNFRVDAGEHSGQMVAELEHVSKSYGSKTVIQDFSCRIMRGDRVGLLGPNGAGKSTLLKLILEEIQPDSGTVRLGTKLSVAYFDQLREQLDENLTLADSISQGSDFIEVNGVRRHVISYLEDFLFPPQRARSPVKSLSGGERNRLLLARLFTRPANLLILDEPTNDLDIETLELLETLLQDYTGTLFLVSHDRTFIDNVVTQAIAFEGEGQLREYAGGYQEWLQSRPDTKTARKENSSIPVSAIKLGQTRKDKSSGSAGLSYQETNELAALPGKIDTLEKEQIAITRKLSDPAIYKDNHNLVMELQTRTAALENELSLHYARWETLENKKDVSESVHKTSR